MKGVTSGAGIAYSFRAVEFTSVFKVAQLSVFCVVFFPPLFVFMSYFFLPLWYLSLFEL
jgi:hypothetical protein